MRTRSGTILAVVMGMIIGCGRSGETPQPEPNKPLSGDQGKSDPSSPSAGTPSTAAPNPAAVATWEMDPAKHAIPAAPVTGKLAGAEFTPKAQLQGETLTFRIVDKDGIPEREVALKVSAQKAKTAGDGLRLVVGPDQSAGPDVPEIMTVAPSEKPGAPGVNAYINGYALTLELGKRDKGRVPGKIFLSLPSDEKDYLAGTFTAEWIRPPTMPPGPDDTPFIQGAVTVTGAANPMVKFGYASQPTPDSFAFDTILMNYVGAGWSRSDHAKPRVSTVAAAEAAGKAARYEHIHLPPGRYLVYAAIEGGPAAWKWVELGPDGQVTADLAVDAAKIGSLEVKVPAGLSETVTLAPADEPGKAVPPGLVLGIALSLGLEQKVKEGAARFDKLGPGRYEVHAGGSSEIVEVKPGETTMVTLAKKK